MRSYKRKIPVVFYSLSTTKITWNIAVIMALNEYRIQDETTVVNFVCLIIMWFFCQQIIYLKRFFCRY